MQEEKLPNLGSSNPTQNSSTNPPIQSPGIGSTPTSSAVASTSPSQVVVNGTVDPIAPPPTQPTAQGGIKMPEPVTPQTSYAGFWIRVLAIIIDGVILSIVIGIVNAVFSGVLGLTAATSTADPTAVNSALLTSLFSISFFINIAITYGYYIGMTGTKGATLGKMALGLRVVDTNGQKIGFGKAALRETIGRWASGIVLGLGYFWVAFDSKKQGWHDKIAGTYVVKIR